MCIAVLEVELVQIQLEHVVMFLGGDQWYRQDCIGQLVGKQ